MCQGKAENNLWWRLSTQRTHRALLPSKSAPCARCLLCRLDLAHHIALSTLLDQFEFQFPYLTALGWFLKLVAGTWRGRACGTLMPEVRRWKSATMAGSYQAGFLKRRTLPVKYDVPNKLSLPEKISIAMCFDLKITACLIVEIRWC